MRAEDAVSLISFFLLFRNILSRLLFKTINRLSHSDSTSAMQLVSSSLLYKYEQNILFVAADRTLVKYQSVASYWDNLIQRI